MQFRLYGLLIALLLVSATPLPVRSQSCYFDFGSTPYYDTPGTSLTQYEPFDDTLFRDVPIGFIFRLGGREWDKMHISSNGKILFGDNPDNPDTLISLLPFEADLVSDLENRSPDISYSFGGCAGAFLMKIQFRDCSFKHGTTDDFINFQVWLYESNGAFEFHYGPGHVSDPAACFDGATGPLTGIRCSAGTSDPYYQVLLEGMPFAPDTTMAPGLTYLEGIPEEGQYYYFEAQLPTLLPDHSTAVSRPYVAYTGQSHEPALILNRTVTEPIRPLIFDALGRVVGQLDEIVPLFDEARPIPIPVAGLMRGTYLVRWTEKGKATALPFVY